MLKVKSWFRLLCGVVVFTFASNVIGQDAARAWSIAEPQSIIMPPPGTLIPASPVFSLPTLKAISIDPQDPFKIDFVVDRADQSLSEKVGQEQINLLIKYFLSFLTLPEEELWVNLSPYEKDRIITPTFETTNAGRDMLEEDYILKQLAASLTYPDHELGKVFWKRVFNRVQTEYGSLDIPVTSFNKVWVVPDRAVVYEENGSAFISESRLKVLTEEDYLSIKKHTDSLSMPSSKRQKIDQISSEITREIIIPELEREVNEGKYFAPLRQMYNALILAIWFKKRYKAHLIGQVYVNQKKTFGITLGEKQIKEKVYTQYLKAFKKGVFNYIKEEPDPLTGQTIPRKYFSGGFSFADTAMRITYKPASMLEEMRNQISALRVGLSKFTLQLMPKGISKTMLMALVAGTVMFGGIHQASASTALPEGMQKTINDVIGIRTADLQNAPVMDKLEAAKKIFENIQPGQSGYEFRESVLTIYNIMHDPVFIYAYPKGSLGEDVVGPNGRTSGKYFAQSRSELKKAEERLKAAENQLSESTVTAVAPIVQEISQPVSPEVSPQAIAEPSPVTPLVDSPVTSQEISPPAVAEEKPVENKKSSGYFLSTTVTPTMEEGVGVKNNDPELESRMAQINTEVEIRTNRLSKLLDLFHQTPPAATSQEVIIAQQKVYEASQELAEISHDDTIGEEQIATFKFKVPLEVNYFNRIKNFTINGKPVESIMSVEVSKDPLENNLQVSLKVGLKSPIPPVQEVALRATILPPDTNDKDLNSIAGGAQAAASVINVDQQDIISPIQGTIKFLVQDGDHVVRDQIAAIVDYRSYGQAYQRIGSIINIIDMRLKLAQDAEGNLPSSEEVDSLRIQRAGLVSKFNSLKELTKLQEVRAPVSGVVNGSAAFKSGVVQQGEKIFSIRKSQVFVGGTDGLEMNEGDPVVVETIWQGVRLPGRVTIVNQTRGVLAYDQQGILQSNLPVKIILPKDDKEKQMILDALLAAEKNETHPVSAGAPPPPEEKRDFFTLPSSTNTVILSQPVIPQTNSFIGIGLNEIDSLVDGNPLIQGPAVNAYRQKKLEEALPAATRFSLNGAAYVRNGKIYFEGGLRGIINNTLGGNVQTGPAISAAVPIVRQIFGNIMDGISGRVHKETKIAEKETDITHFQGETLRKNKKNVGNYLLIDIGAAKEKKTLLEQLLDYLNNARSVMMTRQSAGISTPEDIEKTKKIEKDILTTQAEILRLNNEKQKETVALNVLRGQSNTNLHQSIPAVLPWGKDFTPIDEKTEINMLAVLTATNSPNSRMQEAMVLGQAVDMRIRLQGLKNLPVLNASDININRGASGSKSLYNLTDPDPTDSPNPAEFLERTSGLTAGENPALGFSFSLFDSVTRTVTRVMTLKKEEAQLNIANLKMELSQEMEQAVGSMRSASEQIKQAQDAYQNAYRNNEISEEIKWQQEIIGYKAQYLKAEADLRKLGLLGPEQPAKNYPANPLELNFVKAVTNSIVGSLGEVDLTDQGPVDRILAPGVVVYKVNDGTTGGGALHNVLPGSNADLRKNMKSLLHSGAAILNGLANKLGGDQSMLSPTGGVDLSSTRDVLQSNQNDNEPSAGENTPLKSFQGFEFQVIGYQPILNPVELFLGSSIEKNGSWFSSKAQPSNHNYV